MTKRSELVKYARLAVEEHLDESTGEINVTHLGEEIADHFELYYAYEEEDYTPQDICFDVAYDVAVEWERKHG